MGSCFQAHLFNGFLNFLEFRQQTPKAAAASLSLLFICGRPEWVSMRSNPVQQTKLTEERLCLLCPYLVHSANKNPKIMNFICCEHSSGSTAAEEPDDDKILLNSQAK